MMSRLARIVFALATLSILAAAPAGAADPQPEKQRPFRIYMALYRGWEEAAQGFKDYFTNQNIPVELIIRDAGQDKAKLPEFVEEAKRLKVDLVFTWGTTVTQEMLGPWDAPDPARHITDIPAVFAIVSQPVSAKVVPDFTSSRRNVTGTQYLVPMETQANLIQSYRPFKKLGVVFNPLESNSQVAIRELKDVAAKQGFEVILKPAPVADGKPVAAEIPRLVREVKQEGGEYLYIAPDSFLVVNRDVLTNAALENRLPTFAAAEQTVVKSKAMFAGVYRYYTVGQLTAYKAEQILVHKKAPADIAIDAPKRLSIILNMPVVRDLEFYPPMSLLGLAEVIEPGEQAAK